MLAEQERIPLIPENTLRAHQVHELTDTRFRAAARLKQALWREEMGLPIGFHQPRGGSRRKLGSRLSTFAGLAGANFFDPAIATLVRRELAYREPGAMLDSQRVRTNLLSSTAMMFNLFGPLKIDLRLANRVVSALFPELSGTVEGIDFEHSPGRGQTEFTGDFTAFDLLIRLVDPNGKRTFLAVEMKFTEAVSDAPATLRPRYDELSRDSGLFTDPDSAALRGGTLQQLWRQTLLAHAMVDRGLYDSGRLVVVAPALNDQVQRAVSLFAKHLATDAPRISFSGLTLERVIAAIATAGEEPLAQALYGRFCDLDPVHALI